MVDPIVRFLRFASFAICAIVIVAFAIFAIDQTKTASGHQVQEITGTPTAQTASPDTSAPAAGAGAGQGATAEASGASSASHENPVHRGIDDVAEALTSPFAGVISAASSEWANQGVRLVLALLVYGFGLGYLARVLRVRV